MLDFGCFRATVALVMFAITTSTVLAQDLSKTSAALRQITQTSDYICYKIPIEAKGSSFEVSGMAKAEVSKLIKKLADLGIRGSITLSEYEGVLQKDVLAAIQGQSQCAERVFNKLVERLLPASSPGAIQYKPAQTAQVNGLEASIEQCRANGAMIVCDLVFVNQLAPRVVYFDNARCCVAHDQRNNVSLAATAAIANRAVALKKYSIKMIGAELQSGVATPIKLDFSGFPPGVESISSLKVNMLLGKSRSELRFTNVPIGK